MSLRLKIILILVGATLVGDAFVISVWQPWFVEKAVEREQQGLRRHLVTLGDALTPFLLQNQIGAIHEVLDATRQRSPDWESITLTDQNSGQLYPLDAERHNDTKDIAILHHTILMNNERLGTLELHVDFSGQRKSLEEQAHLIVGVLTIGSVLASVLIAALLEMVFGRRTNLLVKAAEDIAHGQYDTQLPTANSDEIGRLANTLDKMRQAIAIEKESLRQARDAAQAANNAKSIFLATMSHEIRTPMNGLLGMAQLLMDDRMDDAQRIDYARTIQNSGQTLLTLLNDILDLSKIEAGKMELSRGSVDPQQLVEECARLFLQSAQEKGLHIEAKWQGPPHRHYEADATRLRQMLSNLVGNAIKFSATGWVRIDASVVEENGPEAVLEFAVTDSGIGIPLEKQARLFLPFSQADSSTTREYGGTGLGLSIIRSLAHLMNGAVGVQSEAGKGSRFWFRVRVGVIAADEATLSAPQNAATGLDRSPTQALAARVLVVEDNAINRKVAEAMLKRHGMESIGVENGQEALDLLQGGECPSLVLMDMQMPVMDGLTATRHIRAWERETGRARLPIIALTANAFAEDDRRCREAGMDDFLTKPLNLDALRAAVAKWGRPQDA